jgi:hypothetical protein
MPGAAGEHGWHGRREPDAARHAPADLLGCHGGAAGTRLTDGTRKLVSLQEITGMEGEVIAMQEIFRFEQTGVDADGKVQGRFLRHRRAAALCRPAADVRRGRAGVRVRS